MAQEWKRLPDADEANRKPGRSGSDLRVVDDSNDDLPGDQPHQQHGADAAPLKWPSAFTQRFERLQGVLRRSLTSPARGRPPTPLVRGGRWVGDPVRDDVETNRRS